MHDFSPIPTLAKILMVIILNNVYSRLQGRHEQFLFFLNELLNPGTVFLPQLKILVTRNICFSIDLKCLPNVDCIIHIIYFIV